MEDKLQAFRIFLIEEAIKANKFFSSNPWYRRAYIDSVRRIMVSFEIAFREELE